ncbi:MAG: toll/interleukin-1 receptor domain-containing protein [Bryobacterales bacterium]|nr:toll/interleukin-1 receptor domain-containing protein [Bryobacterales bacterium]
MSDPAQAREIFISYSSKDRERVRILVEALVRQGLPVWWDQHIVPGQNWENELEQALHRARAVIVLWSQHSVVSDEVKAEANYALKRRNLIPALLDDAVIPYRYRRTQTPDLSPWDGAEDAPSFRALLAALAAAPTAPPAPNSFRRRATLISWAWILVPSLVLGSLTAALMVRKAPTELEVEVTCSRVRFHSLAGDPQVLLDSTLANSIVLRGFEQVRLPAADVEAANPAKWNDQQNQYPEDAWVKVAPGPGLVCRPTERTPAQVTIEPFTKAAGPLTLERIYTGPAAVTLSSPERATLNVELRGRQFSGSVTLPAPTKLIADDCAWVGAAPPSKQPSVTLRLSPRGPQRLLDYSAGKAGMVFVLGFPRERTSPIMRPAAFEIDQLEFLDQGPAGSPISSIRTGGTIRYPKYAERPAATVNAGDFLTLGDFKTFYLREVAFTQQEENLRLKFQGVAGKALIGPGEGSMRDLRLTQFDELWSNQKLIALFTVLAWVVATSLGLRRYLLGPR